MKEFNYQDYLNYQELKIEEKRGILELHDVSEKYEVHQPHDKIFKIVLEEKKEVVGLLNRILELEKEIKEEEIEKYDNKYINYMFQDRESDIVYKLKEKEIYFLIEHQSRIDYAMPKRILEYETEIISKALNGRKMTKKEHKLPRVIPIVIYTGNRKWNVEKYIEECQEKLIKSEQIKLGQYYVVDVNDYTKEELEKDKLFLSTMMLLERIETEEELVQVLERVIKKEKRGEKREILRRIIQLILKERISIENQEKLLNKLKTEGNDMILEVLRKESEKQRREGRIEGRILGKREGKIEGKCETIIQLLKAGVNKEIICKATNMTEQEIEKLAENI